MSLLAFAHRRVAVDRVVYATITLMSVLIIYDGWQDLKLLEIAGVIVGPVLAMFLGHVFSAAIARQVELGRVLNNPERIALLRSEAPFLLLCVPPLVLAIVLHLFGVSLSDSITVIVWVGVASLGFWGGVAGRRAGFVGWRLASTVVAGLVVGGVVLMLQVLLQPGRVV
jgi:hypothetical protein